MASSAVQRRHRDLRRCPELATSFLSDPTHSSVEHAGMFVSNTTG